jgi:hypothetical protein
MTKLALLLVMAMATTACNKDKECPTPVSETPAVPVPVEKPEVAPVVEEKVVDKPAEKPVDTNKPKKHKKYEGTKVPT